MRTFRQFIEAVDPLRPGDYNNAFNDTLHTLQNWTEPGVGNPKDSPEKWCERVLIKMEQQPDGEYKQGVLDAINTFLSGKKSRFINVEDN